MYQKGKGMSKGMMMNPAGHEPKETVAQVSKYPDAVLPERGIRAEVLKKFGVKMALNATTRTVDAIYFPYYNEGGKLVGYKKRDLTKDKYETGHFTAIGSQGVHSKLFGQQVAEQIQRPKKKLIIVEGEWDVLSAYQACLDSVAGTKYMGLEPYVVGLSCGTANGKAAITKNLDFIRPFSTVVLGLDNDSSTPEERQKGIKKGMEATEDIGISLTGKELLLADYGAFHDPNDMIKAGEWEKLSVQLTFPTKKFTAEKIVTADHLDFEELIAKRVEGIHIPQFPELMELLHGFRVRELTVVTGPSGFGKSTVMSTIAGELRLAGKKVGMIFLEEEYKETVLRMMAHKLKVSYNKLKSDPLKYVSREELKAAHEWTKEDDGFVFLNHFGSIQIEELMNKIRYFVAVYEVDYIILDHLSMCVSGLKTEDERKLLDMVMTELAAFCASTDVGIMAVSHLNRGVAQEFKAPKGKENEPFWVHVRKEDLRGSAGLEQMSWIVLGIEPQILPDRSRGCIRIVVLKNRPWGYLGEADILKMNSETGVLETSLGH